MMKLFDDHTVLLRGYVWCRQISVLTHKELFQLFRDTLLLFFVFYAFTGNIYLAGSGISLQLNKAATVVHDDDNSLASRELMHRFRPPYFHLHGEIANTKEGIRLLDLGEEMILLDIPPRFQESMLKGELTGVQMQVDTTNSVLGTLAAGYGEQIVGRFGLDSGLARMGLSPESLNAVPNLREEHRILFNPNQDNSWFMTITELLNMITLFAIMLPAAAMAREKEKGTIEQLLVSPLTPFQIMISKVLATMIVILVGTMLSLFGVLQFIFHVPMRGSLPLLFAVTVLYIFTTTGIGLFIATITRNLAQVGLLTLMIFAPMVFLSGAWTPPEALIWWIRLLMKLSPLHYFLDVGLGILLKGGGLMALWEPILGMTIIGGVVFTFGLWRFRRQFD